MPMLHRRLELGAKSLRRTPMTPLTEKCRLYCYEKAVHNYCNSETIEAVGFRRRVKTVLDYVRGDSQLPFLVLSEAGQGATSLLQALYVQCTNRYADNSLVTYVNLARQRIATFPELWRYLSNILADRIALRDRNLYSFVRGVTHLRH